MEEDTKYKKYLKALERIEAKTKLDKATKKVKDMLSAKAAERDSFVKRRMELAGMDAFKKTIGVFPKVSQAGKDAAAYAAKAAKASKYGKIAAGVAGAGIAASAYLRSKMKDIKEKQQAEGKMGGGMMKKYKSGGLSPKVSNDAFLKKRMDAYKKTIGVLPKVSQGFAPSGEDAFLKKRMGIEGVKSFFKIPKIGKIMGAAAAITAAGNYVGKKAYDKLKDKDKKMGGGMMYKYKSGGLSPKQKKIASMAPPPDRITGEDFQAMKIMKAKSGSMVHVKTKIGKNKPTKIY